MIVLVTGGAGFIGSHLVERLAGRGDTVVVVDDFNDYYDTKLKRINARTISEKKTVSIIEADIRDAAMMERVFAGYSFDVVAHLAARAGVRPSLENPVLYDQVNCSGTLNLLETARRHGVKRFVFASSSSVYGNNRVPFTEGDPVRPLSPYGATKAAGEVYFRTYHDLYGISCNVLRFFTVYGARQRPDMAIHKFTRLISQGRTIPFYGDGKTRRDYTYFTDTIAGVVAAIDRDLGFEIFNLGESRTTELTRLVEIIEQNVGKKAVLERMPAQPGDVEETYADVSKARELLDYKPTTPVEDGIKLFVEWFKKQQ